MGAASRYGVSAVIPGLSGTLTVNVTGSFVLGVVLYGSILSDAYSRKMRFLVATGFLSSFTTYSTFALKTVEGAPLVAIANVLANYVLGFVAVFIGKEIVEKTDGEVSTGG